jgi:hypothetical protein
MKQSLLESKMACLYDHRFPYAAINKKRTVMSEILRSPRVEKALLKFRSCLRSMHPDYAELEEEMSDWELEDREEYLFYREVTLRLIDLHRAAITGKRGEDRWIQLQCLKDAQMSLERTLRRFQLDNTRRKGRALTEEWRKRVQEAL